MLDGEVRGFTVKHLCDGSVFFAASPAGVEHVVVLFFHFFTCEGDFFCVDDDDEVTGIHVRCVEGFIATSEDVCDFDG